jgi:uncharacterized protein YdeI (YjbR/CyaY-like superfamily)
MNFYTALNGTKNAKATWKDLTPSEKRDFISWVESPKESEVRRNRVEKAVLMLVAGKHKP